MRGCGVLSRRAWALAFVASCGALLAICLGGQSARVAVREPLVQRAARGPLVLVPLAESAEPAWRAAASIRLAATEAGELLSHDELRLFVSVAGGAGRVRRAELRVPGGACRFEATNAPIVEGEPLTLRRVAGCAAWKSASTLELAVETEDRRPAGLWAHRPRDGSSERGRLLVAAPGGVGLLSARGFSVDWPPTAPRVALLNAMWRRAGSAGWLWSLLLVGVGLALAGCLVLPTGHHPDRAGTRGPFVLACAAGTALLAGGLAVLYVVATPPLCGPDEPYHLMGFSELVGEPVRVDDTLEWMAETHQMRIRHHPEERFRTVDVGRPEAARDPEARPTEARMRSAALAASWRLIGPTLAGRAAPEALLALRLLNALAFAAAMGAAAALAASAASPQWIPVALLVVPSLPFFAMHVSETALLCSAYVLLGTSVAVMFLDGPRAHLAGPPLGLACGLMLAGGRSPWPLGGVVGAVLAARALLGPGKDAPRHAAHIFWLGFGLGGLVFYPLLNPEYVASLTALSGLAPLRLQPAVKQAFSSPLMLAGASVLGLTLETAVGMLRWRHATSLRAPADWLTRWCALSAAALVVLSLAASLVLPLPQLPLEPKHPLTLHERLFDVLATGATLFRLREPNFLLATSFWVGFGWLDAIPGPILQALLVLLVAAATVALFLALARPPQPRRLAFLALLAAGGVASLALYTVVTQDQAMALQGRYLIGWYLIFLSIAACGLAGLTRGDGTHAPRLVRWLPAMLLVAVGAIHTYCLCFILRRYF